MRIKRDAELAIEAVLGLMSQEGPCFSEAVLPGASQQERSAIMKRLVDHGLAQRLSNRLYALAPTARKKTVLDVIEAGQGSLRLEGYNTGRCGVVRQALERAEASARRVLSRLKITNLQERTPG